MKKYIVILACILLAGMTLGAQDYIRGNQTFGYYVTGGNIEITEDYIDFKDNGNTLCIQVPDIEGTLIIEATSTSYANGAFMAKWDNESSYSNYNISTLDDNGNGYRIAITRDSGDAATLWAYASGMSQGQHLYIHSIQFVVDGETLYIETKDASQ
jgi:hypothetical protein